MPRLGFALSADGIQNEKLIENIGVKGTNERFKRDQQPILPEVRYPERIAIPGLETQGYYNRGKLRSWVGQAYKD